MATSDRAMPRLAAAAVVLLLAFGAWAKPRPAARIMDDWGSSVVTVEFRLRPSDLPRGGEGAAETRLAAAVMVSEDGLFVTPGDHVPEVDPLPTDLVPVEFELLLPDGRRVPAELVAADRNLNLAFLRSDPDGLGGMKPADMGSAEDLEVGASVMVLSPLPRELGDAIAYRRNEIVAVLDEPFAFGVLDRPVDDLEIGGLVVDDSGRLLGIIGEKVIRGTQPPTKPFGFLRLFGSSQQGPVGGYPGVLPGEVIRPLISAPPMLEMERPPESRGWLGITMQPLSKELADYWDLGEVGGVIIGAVVDGSPAYEAGIRRGDIILGFDGEEIPVFTRNDLPWVQRVVRRAGAGAELDVVYWREGERYRTTVTLAPSPATRVTAQRFESESFGLTARELTYDMRQALNLPEEVAGVVVESVERGGWANLAGVRPGDIVLSVDDEETASLDGFRDALRRAEDEQLPEIQMLLQRQFRTFFLPVATEWKR